MVATNSVTVRTGNVSAGTSVFAMIVLEKALKKLHEEIDMVTTPDGAPVAMVHCNNCTSDVNAWVSVLRETVNLFGADPKPGEIYTKLYEKALEGDADCGGVLVCNYLAGEGVTHLDEGRPMVVRRPDSRFTLANFFRASLYSTMATLKLGMDILAQEGVAIDRLTGHGVFVQLDKLQLVDLQPQLRLREEASRRARILDNEVVEAVHNIEV